MVKMWIIKLTKQAVKDTKYLKEANLDIKAKRILNAMANDPFIIPPSYEKLVGDLQGYYSRRINIKHRIVYKVHKNIKTIVVHSMWTHYDK